jgi:hypothetical protein
VELGPVFGGLATAGVFLLIALIGAAVSVVMRRQTRERAIVEQVSSTRTLLDPRAFHLAIQAGRALGWQRLVPLLLIGILGVQWARETHKMLAVQTALDADERSRAPDVNVEPLRWRLRIAS